MNSNESIFGSCTSNHVTKNHVRYQQKTRENPNRNDNVTNGLCYGYVTNGPKYIRLLRV